MSCKSTMGHAYIGAGLQHVIAIPAGNGDKGHCVWIVTNLLDVGTDFFNNFIISLLAVVGFSGVHLVDAYNELLDSQGVGQQGMFSGLSVLGYASLKLAYTSRHDQHSTIGLKEWNEIQTRGQRRTPELCHGTFTERTWDVPVIMFLIKSL